MHRLIKPAQYREVPWRNGRGLSWEIALDDNHPQAARGLFNWRFAIAKIDNNGEFSAFNNVDRTIALLEGNGFELTVGEGDDQRKLPLTNVGDYQAFAGDQPTSCSLRDGSVRVLNVMTARGEWQARVRVFSTGEQLEFLASANVLVLFSISGTLDIFINDEPLTVEAFATVCIESTDPTASGQIRVSSEKPLAGHLYSATLTRI